MLRKFISDSPSQVTQIHLHNMDRDTSVLISRSELTLAEKRTSLAMLRTAIAILSVPLSILSFLVATSHYYSLSGVRNIVIPLFLFLAALILIGIYLLFKSIFQIRQYDRLFSELSRKINQTVNKEKHH